MIKKLNRAAALLVLAVLVAMTFIPAFSLAAFAEGEDVSAESAEDSSAEESTAESAEDSSAEESPEESSEESAEESSEESETEHPEKVSLVLKDDKGYVSVSRGYVGYSFDESTGLHTYTYKYGTQAELVFEPAADTYLSELYVDGSAASATDGKLVFSMTSDKVVSAFFLNYEYVNIDIVCPDNVTFSVGGKPVEGAVAVCPSGFDAIINFTSEEGLYLYEAYFTNEAGVSKTCVIDNENHYVVIPMLSSAGTLALTFGKPPVTLTVNESAGGTVTADNTAPKLGDSVIFTFTPDEGYMLESITLNGLSIPYTESTYTAAANGDITISAVFKPLPTDVRVTLVTLPDSTGGTHGSLIFAGTTETERVVAPGTEITVIALPEAGYKITEIRVNGILKTADSAGLFTAVITEETEITVSFVASRYRVTAVVTADGGGTITCSDSKYVITDHVVYVAAGDNITFIFTPDMNYILYSVKIDSVTVFSAKNGDVLEGNSYTFKAVSGNHTVAVAFAPSGTVINEYKLNASAGTGGTITPSGEQTVLQGERPSYIVTANEGYVIDYVTVDGIDVSLVSGTYTFEPVSADHTIVAHFKVKQGQTTDPTAPLGVDDVDWTTYDITLNLASNTKISRDVLIKLAMNFGGRTCIIKTAEYQMSFSVKSEILSQIAPEDAVFDLAVLRDSAIEHYSEATASLNPGENTVMTAVMLNKLFVGAQTSVDKLFLGSSFAGKTVSYYVYDMDENTVVKLGDKKCDDAGYVVAIPLTQSNILMFVASVPVAENYTVTVTAGEGGAVSPLGKQLVKDGDTFTFTVVPEEGYRISRISIDGKTSEVNGTSYKVKIVSDTEIDVRFSLIDKTGSPKAGLIICIAIIGIALIGGAVLFVIKLKQTKY